MKELQETSEDEHGVDSMAWLESRPWRIVDILAILFCPRAIKMVKAGNVAQAIATYILWVHFFSAKASDENWIEKTLEKWGKNGKYKYALGETCGGRINMKNHGLLLRAKKVAGNSPQARARY